MLPNSSGKIPVGQALASKGKNEFNKTTLEGTVQYIQSDTQQLRAGLQTSHGEGRVLKPSSTEDAGPVNFQNLKSGQQSQDAADLLPDPASRAKSQPSLFRRHQKRQLTAAEYLARRKRRGQPLEITAASVTNALEGMPTINRTKPLASLYQGKGTHVFRNQSTMSYQALGPDGLRQNGMGLLQGPGVVSSDFKRRMPLTLQNSMTRVGEAAVAAATGKSGARTFGGKRLVANNFM